MITFLALKQQFRIEIHAWNILKNLFEWLSQSGASMIITEISKDVDPGIQY